MDRYCLVYDTFAGFKSEVFSNHKEAFKAYKAIVHSEKCIYLVDDEKKVVQPINSSFSPFEYGRVKAWEFISKLFPSYKREE